MVHRCLFWLWKGVAKFAQECKSVVAESAMSFEDDWDDVVWSVLALFVALRLLGCKAWCDRRNMVTRQGCMCEGGGNHDVEVDRKGGGVPSDVRTIGSGVFVVLVYALICRCWCCGVWENLFDERGVACNVFDDFGKFVSDGVVSGIAVRAKRALERVMHSWCPWFVAASCVGAALARMVSSRVCGLLRRSSFWQWQSAHLTVV